ncbi:MAG: nucleoside hydrolase [Thermoguttaceae bacterium]|nr:nucleoside hydrolase [Thermoguttaceae bacterium]
MKHKIILDIEPGITDVLTLYFALFEPALDVQGITVCGGGNPLPASLRCVQRILDSLQPPKMPRLGVGMGTLPMPMGDWEAFHSSAYSSAMELPGADYFSVHPAGQIIADLIRENPHEITLVTLGPLTNAARVFGFGNALSTLLHRLIIVGGTVLEPGNATPAAEYNFFRSPTAAAQIFRSDVRKTLIPLDVTNRLTLDYDLLRRLPTGESTMSQFLHLTVNRLFQLHRELLGIEGIFVPGLIALQAILHPEHFISRPMHGEVEIHGDQTLGMTVFDRRLHPRNTPNLEVLTDVQTGQIQAEIYGFLERLSAAAL